MKTFAQFVDKTTGMNYFKRIMKKNMKIIVKADDFMS